MAENNLIRLLQSILELLDERLPPPFPGPPSLAPQLQRRLGRLEEEVERLEEDLAEERRIRARGFTVARQRRAKGDGRLEGKLAEERRIREQGFSDIRTRVKALEEERRL